MLETAALWASVFGALIALFAIAWAAVQYVLLRRREMQHEEYRKFFEIMDHLGAEGHAVASKMAAAYELRKFPQYKEVIGRLARNASYAGESADMLRNELELTAKFLEEGG